jgi:FAD/FMN-containing dehydrogenase
VPTVVAGPVLHAWEHAGAALRFHREVTRAVPDELTIGAALLASPDGSGAKVAALVPCHCDPATADDDLAALRAFGRPVVDAVRSMPYPVVNTLLDPAFPAGAHNYWKSGFLDELSDAAIDVLVRSYGEVPSPMTGIFLDHLHGAATRVDPAATAFPHRTEAFSVLILGQWATPDETAENIAWVRRTYDALRPHLSGRRYSNFMAADDTALIDSAYDANHRRLTDVKRRYDPDNVFHLNVNVVPA